MTWSELPTEILLFVTTFLTKKETCELARVCKNWNQVATSVIYKHVFLSTKLTLVAFKDLIRDNNKGSFVQRIELCGKLGMGDVAHIEEVAKWCPDVKELTRSDDQIYSSQVWFSFRHFKALQILPNPIEKEANGYMKCAQSYKDSLKEYNVSEWHPFSEEEDCFEKTTRIVDFDKMIDSVPNLESLALEVKWYDLAVDEIIVFYTGAPGLSLIIPNNKTWEVKFDGLYDKYAFEYFMHKFPHLQRLTVNLYNPDTIAIEDEKTHWSEDYIKKVCDYLSRIPQQFITLFCDYESTINFLKHRISKSVGVELGHASDILFNLCFDFKKTIITNPSYFSLDQLLDFWRELTIVEALTIKHRKTMDIDEIPVVFIDALNYCRRIRTLELQCNVPLECPNIAIDYADYHNPFLESMSIEAHFIDKEILNLFSGLYPSLKQMKIVINPSTKFEKKFEHSIEMPYTSFDHLSLSFGYKMYGYSALILIRSGSGELKPLAVFREGLCTLVDDDVNLSVSPKLVIHITCRSIYSREFSQKDAHLRKYMIDLK
ncbi:unnamed protein product [Rhizopus stolonifer]